MPLRATALVATILLAALAAASSALAATTRYTAPGASGPEPCAEAAPCEIHNAVQNATAGDTVVITPGEYGTPAMPLTTAIVATPKLSITGVPGQPRPIIHGNATNMLRITHAESTLRWVEVRNAGVTSAIFFRGALAEQVVGRATRINAYGCNVQNGTVLNSVCSSSGDGGNGVGVATSGGGPAQPQPDVTLRGVTAWASGSNSTGIEVSSGGGIQRTYKVFNTIAQGTLRDLYATTDADADSKAKIEIQDSNFDQPVTTGAGASIVQGPNIVTAPPLLADTNAGDFHQLAGSPTIDKGANVVGNGAEDFEGNPRFIDSTDIGADEYLPLPAADTDAFGSITRTSARVTGRVTPKGSPTSYRFEYGTTTDYGQSTPAQDAGSGLDAVPAFAELTGLTPGTLYHFRLVASNASGTTAGADMTFTTEAVPPPVVGSIKLTSKVFRIGSKLPALIGAQKKKAPVGTIIRFNLNEPANAKISFRKLVSGRRVGSKCRAPSRSNRGRPSCTRKVKVKGSIAFLAKAGLNQLRFHGRIDSKRRLGVGRYELSVVATDAFGRIAPAKRASFRIVLR
jgi:hypothetical protein